MLPKINSGLTAGVAAVALAILIGAPGMAIAAGNNTDAQLAPAWSTQAQNNSCKIVGAISHRCWTFHSDSAWPEGLADYHGSNGA
jgi:hypothetical protein